MNHIQKLQRTRPKAIRPMKPINLSTALDSITYPKYASYKLNGIRALITPEGAQSNSGKLLPNRHIQAWVARNSAALLGLDGEFVVGEMDAEDVWNRTTSGVMSYDGEPKFTFWVFGRWNVPLFVPIYNQVLPQECRVLHQSLITSRQELEVLYKEALELGLEGLVLRKPSGAYKYGRSTTSEQGMVKIKPKETGEAIILDMQELMHNDNPLEASELGYAKRSKSAEGLVPAGVMGKLIVRDLKTNAIFGIGTGFTAAQRKEFWQQRHSLCAQNILAHYEFCPIGVDPTTNIPLQPSFKGFRDWRDMT